MRAWSIFCGMGLLDRGFLDEGFGVLPLCEIEPSQRRLYQQLCGREPVCWDSREVPQRVTAMPGWGLIGGPPCQSLSKMRSFRKPKFADLTPDVQAIVDALRPSWWVLENVAPLALEGSQHVLIDAMHFGQPHQSRPRWFTYGGGLHPPPKTFSGSVDDLCAYPVVMGRVYGPKRGARLQGYPEAARLRAPCVELQLGLANAVHYDVARAWARAVKQAIGEAP